MLLQCATPDAVARLPCTQLAQQADNLWATYFTVQEHSSLTAFLRNVLTTEEKREDKGTLIQVSTVNNEPSDLVNFNVCLKQKTYLPGSFLLWTVSWCLKRLI